MDPKGQAHLFDIFSRDLVTDATELVSSRFGGPEMTAANGESGMWQLSGDDGSIVLFSSTATDLVAESAPGGSSLFVRNLTDKSTKAASVMSGVTANRGVGSMTITPNGRFVAFASDSTDLVMGPPDYNGAADVFVRDTATGVTELVSVNSSGTGTGFMCGSGGAGCLASSAGPAISADGRYVAFLSLANDLVEGALTQGGGIGDIFVRDRLTGRTTLVSHIDAAWLPSAPSSAPFVKAGGTFPVISADGRYVAFWSRSSFLLPDWISADDRIFVRDVQTGTLLLVTVDAAGRAVHCVHVTRG